MYSKILPLTLADNVKPEQHSEPRNASLGAMLLRTLQALLPRRMARESRPRASITASAGAVRHVWAAEIALRAAPNVMAPELARLQRGALVQIASDGSAPVAHRATAARHDVCVTLDGHWREVLAEGRHGWVFDGCLSRYPAPAACTPEQLAYAAQVFGAEVGTEVGTGKRTKVKWAVSGHACASEVYWTRVAFDTSGERMAMRGKGATENLAAEGMPLTFNEALLWWLHFHKAQR